MKPRQHVYFDHALAERLDTHASRTGVSKSSVVTAAVRAYLDNRGAKELDDLLGVRLRRIERNQEVILESLALFVRYQLTVTAPLPEADAAALAVGQDRFQAFISQVGRRIASGRGFSHELVMTATQAEARP
ncbi:MAG: CopG family transcriptional regulator [Rhodospirillaceae bacterium]|nr:CopG family transcriptional regulator [Rhodospirillaceae bacterium]